MTPQTMTAGQEAQEQPRPEEQFVRQVEDRSLPAQQVLSDQQEVRKQDQAPALFVP